MQGARFRVFGFRVSGFGLRFSGFGFWVSGFGFWVRVVGVQVSGDWIFEFRFHVVRFLARVVGF